MKRQSEEGSQFGFTGKQVIHPSQVDIVQAAFSPSPEKIRWAEELVRSFKKHQEEGKVIYPFFSLSDYSSIINAFLAFPPILLPLFANFIYLF